ncbi:C4-dicarboxylic acid transporter DauA [Motiliproteus sediminis]|uniref:C4-dicarboxylic acid transporter DauA n=1 Tax=Motiliproteus sediminis TaxID=1468178 RepID=UPI001AEF76B9|nr:C4-dicarboxylic acid transporter DauA [Motiliproteus sediminis]
MPHRTTQLRPFSALREAIHDGYRLPHLRADILAGITVGIIAIPLAMALAIASGVAPQYGLYTAIIAGLLTPLTGGSRYSVSGPTAAFIVILYPIASSYGLSGLLVATLMAGAMLVIMSIARLGRLIEYIPEPVTLGFTSGIAVVIATLQIKDFFGLRLESLPESYLDKVVTLLQWLPATSPAELTVGLVTLLILLLWPRLKIAVPGHLPAIACGVAASLLLTAGGASVDTIGSRFHYLLEDGSSGFGIPPILPQFQWPWLLPGPDGMPLQWNLQLLISLLPAAFSIAMLGAIESLLCAVVLDGMSGKRHHSNGELLGQGVGNLIAPWFGGITATAALARSAANFRAGARSPIAAMVHALVILFSLLALAPWLSYIPMASMAAMLLVVAWNMSEAHKVSELLRKAPNGDIIVLLVCFSLTVLVDMVVAISVGIVLAALLFMREIASMTKVTDISDNPKHVPEPLPPGWAIYKISGPLFFAAADRIFVELEQRATDHSGVVLYMDGVTILDAGGLSALRHFLAFAADSGKRVIIADLQFQPLRTVAKSGLQPITDQLAFTATLAEGVAMVQSSQRAMD